MKFILIQTLFLIIFLSFFTACEKKPTAPVVDNPLDIENTETTGDPFQLTAQIGNGGITLNWNKPAIKSIKTFNIYRSEQENTGYKKVGSTNPNTTIYVDRTVSNGHSYWYVVTAADNKGHESSRTNVSAVNIKTAPVLVINNGAFSTVSREVNLTIIANTAVEMMLSNFSDFAGANWEPYTTSKTWTLEKGEGKKTVYLKVKYDNGTESDTVSAEINPTPINGSIEIDHPFYTKYAYKRQINLKLQATGTNLRMKISEDSTFSDVEWEPFSLKKEFELSTGGELKTVYAKFINDFDIESEIVSDSILPVPMNPSMIIGYDNHDFVKYQNVYIKITASGWNLRAKVSEDSTFTGVGWDWYVGGGYFDFPLSDGDGIKKIYAIVKNDFEVVSELLKGEILMDTTPPKIKIDFWPDSGIVNETTFRFDLTQSFDTVTPTSDLKIRFYWPEENIVDTYWLEMQPLDHVFSYGGGEKEVKIEVKDNVGWVADTTVNIFVNTRPYAMFNVYVMDNINDKKVLFDVSNYGDYEDGDSISFRWDFDGDGSWDTDWVTQDSIFHSFDQFGSYTVYLMVKDQDGLTNQYEKTFEINAPLIPLIYVEGGTFTMGDEFGDGYADELPLHTVKVNSFYIGKYELTQKEWKTVMGNNPSNWIGDNLPVNKISWYEAIEFCNRLSELESLEPCYIIDGDNVTCDFTKNGYRLPTEAEWEYAAKDGQLSQHFKFCGSNQIEAVGWYYENSNGKTHDVGLKQPNELGLYDMSGNVSEWCWDWYYNKYYSVSPIDNPKGPDGENLGNKVARGGFYNSSARGVRCSSRDVHIVPNGQVSFVGLRVVRTFK